VYKGLMEWLETCPQLAGQTLNFDFIGANPVEWSLQIPTNSPDTGATVTGSKLCKQDFILVCISNFGDDALMNINNLDVFQSIKKWFAAQTRSKVFPDLGADKQVTKVLAVTDGYIEATTESAARYQIQCRVEYAEEAVLAGTQIQHTKRGNYYYI